MPYIPASDSLNRDLVLMDHVKSLKESMTSFEKEEGKKKNKDHESSQKNSNAPTLLVANINMRLMITSSMKSRASLSLTTTPGKKRVLFMRH